MNNPLIDNMGLVLILSLPAEDLVARGADGAGEEERVDQPVLLEQPDDHVREEALYNFVNREHNILTA